MRTDDLVTMLATGAPAVEPNVAARRYASAIGWGALGAVLLLGILLGVRRDLAVAVLLPMFWVKIAFVIGLAMASLFAVLRLSRPGQRIAGVPGALAAPVLGMWTLGAFVLLRADQAQRVSLFFGETWESCPYLVAMLSAPVFVAVVWAMRGLAPTRLRLAGTAAGFLSGAIGALVYCLHCPELEAPFLGFWYLLGMLIPSAFGALLGPRLLRW
ncbi:MAG: DUF1109 domain-containing protein [Betaproteobacteria bacterium]|nr:MAG: DUF1109 domain-containing protein [Betaproteobacteria bacterium]